MCANVGFLLFFVLEQVLLYARCLHSVWTGVFVYINMTHFILFTVIQSSVLFVFTGNKMRETRTAVQNQETKVCSISCDKIYSEFGFS